MLSAWATHFRQHYITDDDLPAMVDGTGLSNADYLRTVLFPDATQPPGPSLRAGDFGEILVADYIEFLMGYWSPRALRYQDRWNRNDSTKGCVANRCSISPIWMARMQTSTSFPSSVASLGVRSPFAVASRRAADALMASAVVVDRRNLERHRSVLARRQDAFEAQPERCRISFLGPLDGLSGQRLRLAVEKSLGRHRRFIARAPRPARGVAGEASAKRASPLFFRCFFSDDSAGLQSVWILAEPHALV